jgi:hypothetical protein
MSSPTAQIQGTVEFIGQTQTFGAKGFRKRLIVLRQDHGKYENIVPLEFTRDDCDRADHLNVGDEVDVQYRLTGRKWQKDAVSEVKYFLTAEALQVHVVRPNPATRLPEPPRAPAAPGAQQELPGVVPEDEFDSDDIPF